MCRGSPKVVSSSYSCPFLSVSWQNSLFLFIFEVYTNDTMHPIIKNLLYSTEYHISHQHARKYSYTHSLVLYHTTNRVQPQSQHPPRTANIFSHWHQCSRRMGPRLIWERRRAGNTKGHGVNTLKRKWAKRPRQNLPNHAILGAVGGGLFMSAHR